MMFHPENSDDNDSSTFDNRDCGLATGKQWFVIYAKPRQEAVAQLNLERQGFEAYLPRLEVTKRRLGQLTTTIEPFFPRYLFIRLNPGTDNWAPIRSTRGVCGLVRFDGVPKPVSNGLIDALMANENNKQLQSVAEISWKPGEKLAIEQGPFAGYRCIFQEQKGIDRVTVLLDIIGKQTRATLLKQDLQIPQFA